jgi:hypothetical protein
MNKKNQRRKFIVFMVGIIFIMILHPLCDAKNTMFIEILPSQPISGQNFTISVYDPLITNDTPYLKDVSIIFLNNTYEITDELPNRELELTAPNVNIPTSFQISAYKNSYDLANKTITILPSTSTPAHLFITVINNTLTANEYFIIRVTDEFNQPIQNATVSIQNQQAQETDGLTNETGYIKLKAPNQKEITILAQKQGYEDDTTNLWIETELDATTAFLSHPFLPVAIAFLILLLSILFVSLRNRKEVHHSTISNDEKLPTDDQLIKNKEPNFKVSNKKKTRLTPTANQNSPSTKIEEINIKKPHNNKKIIHISAKTTSEKENHSHKEVKQSHQWFSSSDTVEKKVDELLSNKDTTKKTDDWFEGTEVIRDAIDKSIKQKKKKST